MVPSRELPLSLMRLGVFLHDSLPLSPPARPSQVSAMVSSITEWALVCEPCDTEVVPRGGSSSLIPRSADRPAPLTELLGSLDLHSYLRLVNQTLLPARVGEGCYPLSVPSGQPPFRSASLSKVSLSATFEATVCKALGTEQKTHPGLLERLKRGGGPWTEARRALPGTDKDALL